jgi:chemotaxis protein MotA
MSLSPILAILLSLVAIIGGNALEGGHFSALVQPTAAIIVMGGTVGAAWLGATDAELKTLRRVLPRVFRANTSDRRKLVEQMVSIAQVVRRDGMLAVENKLGEIDNAFLKKGLGLLVDGNSAEDVAKVLELEVEIETHHEVAAGKILESAGGFAPTIGILGAVLGLIHVMQNLSDPSKLGTGIAVAFVATIYGVGSANVLFIPLGNRMKKMVQEEAEVKNMILNGLEVIASGANPRQVEETLSPYVGHDHTKPKEAA